VNRKQINLLLALFAGGALVALAGPPFATDDPEPVDYRHWEFYIASQDAEAAGGDWSGTAPHIEINYGVISNVQLHAIAPLSYVAPHDGNFHFGYGDSELGVKFRFLGQTDKLPDAGIFPLLEVPTGRQSEGLGSGHLQAFLPLWLQKDFGDWSIYGGGGYGINPGSGNKNWGFVGAVLQKQITKNFLFGGEIYHRTAMQTGGRGDTAFNVGFVADFSEHQHLLFSAGRSIDGPTDFQTYIAWQFTFGPEVFHSFAKPGMP
jgi:hypothetical protein